MTIRRGVSLYSYQQAQFFKELLLEDQLREVAENLPGADGIETIDELSFPYPDPDAAFVRQWHQWMERYATVPVALDVSMDVLQFRDHVMSYDECADRLRHDLQLAHTLGFRIVRCISVVPLEVMLAALPLAESLDIRLGKEIHQPMPLDGGQVEEIVAFVDRTGTRHLGIVPDFGILQFRPSEVLLDWFQRRGAKPEACEASVALALLIRNGAAPFPLPEMAYRTAGNLRSDLTRWLRTGECEPELLPLFSSVKAFAEAQVPDPSELDHTVVAEALMLSGTRPEHLQELAPYVVHAHGKFYNMTAVPGAPGDYDDISIDYEGGIGALVRGGFDGYVNSEYEGQRYFQDRTRAELADEVEQVRRHQAMLRRLLDRPTEAGVAPAAGGDR
ncbi:MAG: xylose isomerase [Actinomycetota bacterium]|nr:xylose isomerase [Actinomycetota bacterium]